MQLRDDARDDRGHLVARQRPVALERTVGIAVDQAVGGERCDRLIRPVIRRHVGERRRRRAQRQPGDSDAGERGGENGGAANHRRVPRREAEIPLRDQQRGVIVDRPVGQQHAARDQPAPAARRMIDEEPRARLQRRFAFVDERERQARVAHRGRHDAGVRAVADRDHVDRERARAADRAARETRRAARCRARAAARRAVRRPRSRICACRDRRRAASADRLQLDVDRKRSAVRIEIDRRLGDQTVLAAQMRHLARDRLALACC